MLGISDQSEGEMSGEIVLLEGEMSGRMSGINIPREMSYTQDRMGKAYREN